MESLDSAIISEYGKFNTPADQLVCDPQVSEAFRKAVNRRLPPDAQVDLPALNKRVLNLRRRGEAKGGLPRLCREYNGRGPNRPR
jgi:hypothetical protein